MLPQDNLNETGSVTRKTSEANSTIKTYIIASLTLGLVPVPFFDMAALTATQMNMMRSLSELYDVTYDDEEIKTILTAFVAGSLPVMTFLGLNSLFKTIPGVGTVFGSASVSITAGALTYALGQTLVMHFESGGTFKDFDASKVRLFFNREYEAGKAFVEEIQKELKTMGNQAVDKLSNPSDGGKSST